MNVKKKRPLAETTTCRRDRPKKYKNKEKQRGETSFIKLNGFY